MSSLTFDFEDKLRRFIEENCNYNFSIVVTKDSSGISFKDTSEVEDESYDLGYLSGRLSDDDEKE